MRRLVLVAFVLFLGCADNGNYTISIAFPDATSKSKAFTLWLAVVEPKAEASCVALLNQTAYPGDLEHPIETETLMALNPPEEARLEKIGPGVRLFYAQARDRLQHPIFNGCLLASTGGSGPKQLTIQLVEICGASIPEICDGIDNNCDGSTDEGDLDILCSSKPNAQAVACMDGRCEYVCLPGWQDANDDYSDGCECHFTRQGVEWCDGLDNDCDGTVDGENCLLCSRDEDCQDMASCLWGTCQSGICTTETLEDEVACDDGFFCTLEDMCLDGICVGTPLDCSALDGFCTRGVCSETEKACQSVLKQAKTACVDGYSCTESDQCDDSGQCLGLENDSLCQEDERCRPDCTQAESGCVKADQHCGPTCMDCTAQASNRVCVDQACGCRTKDDCFPGDDCNDNRCTTCIPNCQGRCGGADDGCLGECHADCPDGFWCENQTCKLCLNPIDVDAQDGMDGESRITFTMPLATNSACTIRRALSGYPTNHTEGVQVGDPTSGDGTSIMVMDTGLENGTTYYYAVFCACNGKGVFNDELDDVPPEVNADTATPQASPPENPKDVVASDGEDSLSVISFTMPKNPVTECIIRRRSNGYPIHHSSGVQVGGSFEGADSWKSFADVGLTNGSTYYYAVFCRNLDLWNDTVVSSSPGNADTGKPVLTPVVFESSSYVGEHSNLSDLSFSHTIGDNPDRLLLVGLSCGSFQPLPNVSYAGQSMVLLEQISSAHTSVKVWSISNPPVGTAFVEITGLWASEDGKIAGAVSLYGVKPENPLGTVATHMGTGDLPELSLASQDDALVVDFVSAFGSKTDEITSGEEQIEHWINVQGTLNFRVGASSRKNGSFMATTSWTISGSEDWVILGVSVLP